MTGVQTCALPISSEKRFTRSVWREASFSILGTVAGGTFRDLAAQRALLERKMLDQPRVEDYMVAAALYQLATGESFLRDVIAVRLKDGIVFQGRNGLELGDQRDTNSFEQFLGPFLGIGGQRKTA